MSHDTLRNRILDLTRQYAEQSFMRKHFQAGKTPIPASGKVIGTREIINLVEASLDGWLTAGRFNRTFEQRLSAWLGVKHLLTVNSGSSANLLALSALTSPMLGKRALQRGDEVITVAACFPTTVTPIIQHGLIPVFVDITTPTYNIDVSRIEAAISPKTRAIVIAHTLGNPFDLGEVTRLAKRHDLWLVEDCCDALGSRYNHRMTGTFGDVAVLSFYPAHHITMGEGGAVFTQSGLLHRILLSMRDWGRDCHCEPGHDNTCGNRFGFRHSDLPQGYDHKYVYSHLGYNLKITDMQAAVGLAQLDHLENFIAARKTNFNFLKERLAELSDILILPEATPLSDPAWFGFPITLRDTCPRPRLELLRYLDERKIGTRLLFSGNIIRQPCFKGVPYRVSGELTQTDVVMNQTFWIGVYPGLDLDMLDYMCAVIRDFLTR
uniref:CDP-6-deoxy-D-xylo-4-hexulose-3-dehydrase n=1 Tax=Candidatus Kentrum sp. DK TaxID=2126562 RepID=A0A450TBM6_9GAMM|nr:MAG: CDP-6-deoxy-D-xylo-4-hexulose-3-dehydrase [Candidatus Kentron sp. DK]